MVLKSQGLLVTALIIIVLAVVEKSMLLKHLKIRPCMHANECIRTCICAEKSMLLICKKNLCFLVLKIYIVDMHEKSMLLKC